MPARHVLCYGKLVPGHVLKLENDRLQVVLTLKTGAKIGCDFAKNWLYDPKQLLISWKKVPISVGNGLNIFA